MILWSIFESSSVDRGLSSGATTLVYIGTDSENDGKQELQLLPVMDQREVKVGYCVGDIGKSSYLVIAWRLIE
jgi:hypothetical protein